jgi:hypothetical protein
LEKWREELGGDDFLINSARICEHTPPTLISKIKQKEKAREKPKPQEIKEIKKPVIEVPKPHIPTKPKEVPIWKNETEKPQPFILSINPNVFNPKALNSSPEKKSPYSMSNPEKIGDIL